MDDDELRAQPHGARHGNRRAHAELARFVAGGGDHSAAVRIPAHRDRLAAKRRIVALLHGRIERVHVDVEDAAHDLKCSSCLTGGQEVRK